MIDVNTPVVPLVLYGSALADKPFVPLNYRLKDEQLQAIVPNPYGPNAGAAVEAEAPFLVTLGRAQPSEFVYRR